MNDNLNQLRERASHPKALHGCSSDPCGSVVCQTARDRDTLLDRVEAAEAALASQRGVVKTLAERNVELTKFKDAYSLQAQELEQAEAERNFRQKENKELFEQIERVRELNRFLPASIMERIIRALDGGEQE